MSRAVWVIVVGLEITKLIKCERYPDLFTSKELEENFGPKSFNREHPYRRKTTVIPEVHRNDIEQEVPLNLELYPQPRPRIPGHEKLFIPGTGIYNSFGPGRQGGSTIPPGERIFPDFKWPPPDSSNHDMNELAKRLTLTNKWPEFLMLTGIEAKKHKPGEVMQNWEQDVEKWAGYSRQLLVRDKYAKEKALRASRALAKMRTTVTTTEPIGPQSGMEMYWGDAMLKSPEASAPVTPKPNLVITPKPFYTYNRPPGLRRAMPGLGEPGYPVDEDLTYAGEENPRKSGAMPGFKGNPEGGGYIGDKPALRGGAPVYDDYASDYPAGRSPNNYKIPGAEENRAFQRQHPESLRMRPGGGGLNGNSQIPVNYNEPSASSGHEDPLADLPGYGADPGAARPGGSYVPSRYGGPPSSPQYGIPNGSPGYGENTGATKPGGPPGPPGYGISPFSSGYGKDPGADRASGPHSPSGYGIHPGSSGYSLPPGPDRLPIPPDYGGGRPPSPPGSGGPPGPPGSGIPPGPPGYGSSGYSQPARPDRLPIPPDYGGGRPPGPPGGGGPPGPPGNGSPPGLSGHDPSGYSQPARPDRLPIPPDYGGGGPPGPPGSFRPPGPPGYGIPPGSLGYSPPPGPDRLPIPPDYGGGGPPGPPGRGGPPSPPGYGIPPGSSGYSPPPGPDRLPIPPDYGGGGPPGPPGRGGPPSPPGYGGDTRALRSGSSSGHGRVPIPPNYGGPPGPHGRGGPSGPSGRGGPPGPPGGGRPSGGPPGGGGPSGGQSSYDPARMGPGEDSGPDYKAIREFNKMPKNSGNVQGMGVASGQDLLKLAEYQMEYFRKLKENVKDNTSVTVQTRPPPVISLKVQLLALPHTDDFDSPIKWVKFNSPETADGLAQVTNPVDKQNEQHIVQGVVYVPVVDHSLLRLGLTEEPTTEAEDVITPPSNHTVLQTMFRNVNLNETNETDWLAAEAIVLDKARNVIKDCDSEACRSRCTRTNCETSCSGDTCSSGCIGVSCVAYCSGPGCNAMCIGEYCSSKCSGESCSTICWGKKCEATCRTFGCTQSANGEFSMPGITWDQAYPEGVRQTIHGEGRLSPGAIGRSGPERAAADDDEYDED